MVLEVLVRVVDREGVAGGVLGPAEITAALVEEELGQIEMIAAAGDAGELGQADLDLLVAGEAAAEAGAASEGPQEQVGVLEGDVEESPLAGGLVVGDGRFVHVPGVVELVADAEVGPALGAGPGGRVGGVVGAGRVEVAVRLLGQGDDADELVEASLEGRVGVKMEGVGGGLHGLVDVGVVEAAALVGAGHEAGGLAEVVDPAGLLVHPEGEGDGDGAVGLEAGGPEIVGEGDPGERDGADGVVGGAGGGFRGRPALAAGDGQGKGRKDDDGQTECPGRPGVHGGAFSGGISNRLWIGLLRPHRVPSVHGR